ncbi:DUF4113 domain-containing protein [Moraxella sp. 179-F 1C4 NHS]
MYLNVEIPVSRIAKQQDWQMNREFLSPSYTTKLSDLLKVH